MRDKCLNGPLYQRLCNLTFKFTWNGCCIMTKSTLEHFFTSRNTPMSPTPPPPLRNLCSTFIKPRLWMITTVQARCERWVHIKMNVKQIERTSFHPIYYCSHFDRVYFPIYCNIFKRDKPLIRTTAAWARLKLCHSLMSLSCGSLVKTGCNILLRHPGNTLPQGWEPF